MKQIAYSREGGFMEYKKVFVERVLIPNLNTSQRKIIASKIEFLVDRILSKKESEPQADTQGIEKQIDELVYQLYGLSDEEIAIVEDKKDAESEYIQFMKEFKKLDSHKARIKFINSKSDEELDLIFEGLDKYREGHTLSKAEEALMSEFDTSTKDRPPSPHAKHSA